MKQGQCPSCGAPLEFKNAASLYIVCDYCKTTSIRKDMDLEAVGKVAEVTEDGSPLKIGTTGVCNKRSFEIVGRIQLHFEAGYWNEWHLNWGGESAWLGETNGTYVFTKLFVKTDLMHIPSFETLKLYDNLFLNGATYYVIDKQKGKVVTGEGELPFNFTCEYKAPVIDLVTQDNLSFATLDYSESKPLLFIGEYTNFEKLNLKRTREVYGFKALV